MSLLTLPPEIRLRIYSLLFPSPKSHIILVPYNPSNPECQFDIPLPLYGVCKTIYNELSPLRERLRSLDLVYIIHVCMEDGKRSPATNEMARAQAKHFERMTKIAETVRVVGRDYTTKKFWRGGRLFPSFKGDCSVRTIEVQPFTTSARIMRIAVKEILTPLIWELLERLEMKLIREGYDPFDDYPISEEKKGEDLDMVEGYFRKWMEMKKPGNEYDDEWRP